jgi:thiol-disulfide isomerase/thioredoxin
MHRRSLLLAPLLGALALAGASGRAARAEGSDLDGRMAPEMTFPAGLNGVGPGTTLSSFRGKVVWIKFWLRDCPHCRKTLPKLQDMHDTYGRSGLQILAVVHKYGPEDVQPVMDQLGYSFPVAMDPDGSRAALYGVQSRPTDYIVGIDGRVRASNGAPDEVIQEELARYRLAELGTVPETLAPVRASVRTGDYGAALRFADAEAKKDDATAEVKAAALRIQKIAESKLHNRVARANAFLRRHRTAEAKSECAGMVESFKGTTLEEKARQLQEACLSRVGGG